jgi:hypothetical protein
MTESKNAKPETSARTFWHQLLGKVFQELLPPVGISVQVGFPILSESPEIDILLLRRDAKWTKEQLSRLPDGVRESQAHHIILEFKDTQSINEMDFQQVFGYELLYTHAQKVTYDAVQTFLLSAQQPQPSRLEKWGYVTTKHDGVYQSDYPLLDKITLLSLNELSDEPHNAWVKFFASRMAEKQKAFKRVKRYLKKVSIELEQLVVLLWQLFVLKKGGDKMAAEMTFKLTHEELEETAKFWGDWFLRNLPAKEVVRHFKPEEILGQVVRHFRPEEILGQFNLQDRLAGLSLKELDEIEGYLKQLKQ